MENWITTLGIIVTFIVGMLSLYISVRNTRKVTYINSITASRIKWIDELREDISEFCGLVEHYRVTDKIKAEVLRGIYENIDVLTFRIIFRLNRLGKIDKLIKSKIEFILQNLDSDDEKPDKELEKLPELTQDLLKFEWERVKLESQKGILTDDQKQKLINNFLGGKYAD